MERPAKHCKSDEDSQGPPLPGRAFLGRLVGPGGATADEAENVVDWLMTIETLVGKHGGVIFGGYCRDFLAYRREVYQLFGHRKKPEDNPNKTRAEPFAQRLHVLRQTMDAVDVPRDVTDRILLSFLDDYDTLASQHCFKDMDVQFLDSAAVCVFVAELEARPGHTVYLSPNSRRGLPHNAHPPGPDVLTVTEHVKHIDLQPPRPFMGHRSVYKPWKRLQIECRPPLDHVRLYIDMTWSMDPIPDNDMGSDYHCNRLQYHPLDQTFTLMPCVEGPGFTQEEDDYIEAENRLFSISDVFKQVYEKRAVLTHRRQRLVNQNNAVAKLKQDRMTKSLGFTVVPSPYAS